MVFPLRNAKQKFRLNIQIENCLSLQQKRTHKAHKRVPSSE